jgi:hypothetical protein
MSSLTENGTQCLSEGTKLLEQDSALQKSSSVFIGGRMQQPLICPTRLIERLSVSQLLRPMYFVQIRTTGKRIVCLRSRSRAELARPKHGAHGYALVPGEKGNREGVMPHRRMAGHPKRFACICRVTDDTQPPTIIFDLV